MNDQDTGDINSAIPRFRDCPKCHQTVRCTYDVEPAWSKVSDTALALGAARLGVALGIAASSQANGIARGFAAIVAGVAEKLLNTHDGPCGRPCEGAYVAPALIEQHRSHTGDDCAFCAELSQ